jgi:hypothetical protein
MAIGGGIGLLVRPSWVGWVLGATIGTFAGAIATKLDRADYASNTSTGTGALPPSRPSCLECTEKHLGAAAVLIGEVGDGYTAHRMLAVGHLNEAADESQAFPALHVAIRESRKNYQTNGVVPDFQALSRLLYAADPSQGVPASAA